MITPKEILDKEEKPSISEAAAAVKIEEEIDRQLKSGFGINKSSSVRIDKLRILSDIFNDYWEYHGFYKKIFDRAIERYENHWSICDAYGYGLTFTEKNNKEPIKYHPLPKKSWIRRFLG